MARTIPTWKGLAMGLAGLLALPLIGGCIPPPTPFGGGTGQIAFVSDRDGNYEIYTTNADGSGGLQRLTNNLEGDHSPAWSPDGAQIAFTRHSEPAGFAEDVVFVMDADGTNEDQLTAGDPSNRAFNPVWSPDGTRIAFQAGTVAPTSAQFRVYAINADGTGLVQLSEHGAYPHWSADGTRITYSSWTGELGEPRTGIYVVQADGALPPQLLTIGGRDTNPAWSSGGSLIAFLAYLPGVREGLYTMAPDGTGLSQLTGSVSIYYGPQWSPDDSTIAFVDAGAGGGDEIVLLELATNQRTSLTDGDSPVWSPDGGWIAFISDRDGDNEVYVIRRNGTGLIQLTNNSDDDLSPAWQP
jgi:TolB protein